MERSPIPVACTLGVNDAERQIDEWATLRSRAISAEAHPTGARLVLPAALEADARDLAQREAACCAFLSIQTTVVAGRVVLDITTDEPDGRAVIALLAGTPLADG
ncbi:MAG: hypothetical protein AAGA42_03390 [Actinomycetota bacterium]